MKELHPNKGLKVFDIKWNVTTAGPSPNNNERIEIFLLGCNKAMEGNPCKDCFNSPTWDKRIAEFSRDSEEVADLIIKGCDPNNKYVTIGGGEPTDQLYFLLPLVKKLKEYDFHIVMYTWRNLKNTLKGIHDPNSYDLAIDYWLNKVLQYIDIIIDGEFKKEEKLWKETETDGFISSIGSANQIIWDIPNKIGYSMKDINSLSLENNNLYFDLKDLAIKHNI